MAGETTLTIIGNLTADPELRFTPSGAAVADWDLGQELLGRPGCAAGPDAVHCAAAMAVQPLNWAMTLPFPCAHHQVAATSRMCLALHKTSVMRCAICTTLPVRSVRNRG